MAAGKHTAAISYRWTFLVALNQLPNVNMFELLCFELVFAEAIDAMS